MESNPYPGKEVSALEGDGCVTQEGDEDGEGPGGDDQPDGDLVDLAGHHQDHLPLLQDSPEPQAEQDTPAQLQYKKKLFFLSGPSWGNSPGI